MARGVTGAARGGGVERAEWSDRGLRFANELSDTVLAVSECMLGSLAGRVDGGSCNCCKINHGTKCTFLNGGCYQKA